MISIDQLIANEIKKKFAEHFPGYRTVENPHPKDSVAGAAYLEGWHACYDEVRKLCEGMVSS